VNEVIALEHDGFAGLSGEPIDEAIAKVQTSRMYSFAEARICGLRDADLGRRDRLDLEAQLIEQLVEASDGFRGGVKTRCGASS
jgi:hypothetical protein